MKFSELTLDMFRMLQALEREPEQYQPFNLENSTDFTDNQVLVIPNRAQGLVMVYVAVP